MDEQTKAELVGLFTTALRTRDEELEHLVERCVGDQVELRALFDGLKARFDAFDARGASWDNRHSGHERALNEERAESKRRDEELERLHREAFEAAGRQHNDLARAVNGMRVELESFGRDVDTKVLAALAKHVHKIERAADRLTKTPQVRTAAAVGGTFAGSAFVAIVIEILKHL